MANELRVRQLAIGGLVEDNPLTNVATTLTSAGLAAVTGGITSAQHMAIILDPDGIDGAPEVSYITALTAAAGSATVVRGQEGTTARQHAAGTPWVHGPTPRDVPHSSQIVQRATGSAMALASTAIAELAAATNGPGTGGFDITLQAYVGDILEWSFSGVSQVPGAAVQTDYDIYTMVSGSRTNPFGAGLSASCASTRGVSAWENASSNYVPLVGSVLYVVQAGDIVSGAVTMRPYYAQASATTMNIFSTANLPFRMWARNLGPPSV